MNSVERTKRARDRRRELTRRGPDVQCHRCGYALWGTSPEVVALFRRQHPDADHEATGYALTIETDEDAAAACSGPWRIDYTDWMRPSLSVPTNTNIVPLATLTPQEKAKIINAAKAIILS